MRALVAVRLYPVADGAPRVLEPAVILAGSVANFSVSGFPLLCQRRQSVAKELAG